jgi:dipeptidyl aminopeptidase/acylaminoacyl peptidase
MTKILPIPQTRCLLVAVLCSFMAMLFAACNTTTPPPPVMAYPPADKPLAVTMPALTLGTHQNLVYYSEAYSSRTDFFGILSRYDTTTHKAVIILKLSNVSVQDAQVSSDGQWILFVARLTDHDELRLVRVDGKFSQTLLYSQPYGALTDIQWSPNQQYVVFDEEPPQSGPFITYLLDIAHRHLQVELTPTNAANSSERVALSFAPRKWLDNSHVLLVGTAPNDYSTPQNIYILDVQKGAKQPTNDLRQVYTGSLACVDVDSNGDGSQLFISTCKIKQYDTGSSTITVQLTNGGTAQTIFTSQKLVVQQIRFVAPHTLLLIMSGGLWKMNTDGTGLTQRIASSSPQTLFFWSQCTQYAWSNVSRDSTLYGLLEHSQGVDTSSTELDYASFNGGGKLQSIASASTGLVLPNTHVLLIGWTTM